MIHTNYPIIKHKVELLNLAEELGHVSKACKVTGASRRVIHSIAIKSSLKTAVLIT